MLNVVMNIVFFMQDTGSVFGAERATIDLAAGLKAAGDSVCFFLMEETRLSHQESALQKAISEQGFRAELFAVSGRISWKLSRAVKEAFHRVDGDVLHVIGYKANLHAWMSGVRPVVATVHGWLFRADVKERLYDAIDRWCLRRCDQVICLSLYYQRLLLEAGIAGGRLKLIPSGLKMIPSEPEVDAVRGQKNQPLVFGMMGRFSEEKNHRMFLDAAKSIHHDFPQTRFRIAGQGLLESRLKERAVEAGLSSAVEFCGYMNVNEFMKSIDVYVVCSRIENLPYSILEAMAWARPVIGTRVGGIPDLVNDQVTGYLVESESSDALAGAMREFVSRSADFLAMGDAGRSRLLQAFTLEKSTAMHQDIYRTLVPN